MTLKVRVLGFLGPVLGASKLRRVGLRLFWELLDALRLFGAWNSWPSACAALPVPATAR